MTELILFVFGASAGSFLKVVADRYEPHLFLWDGKIIGGRSRCPSCGAGLRWFELIPLFSYLFQRGKCRRCGRRIGFGYPLTEIVSGFIFVFVPAVLKSPYLPLTTYHLLSIVWIAVFLTLLVVSLIDFRLRIIPDEANAVILALGILIIFFQPFGELQGSFLGHYALLFGLRQNIWLNHLFALFIAGAFFAVLILLTKGRAMGVGDLKLASALGFVFGWPDIVLLAVLSFIIGSFIGVGAVISRRKTMKSHIAFGPFLAAASFVVFFFGYQIIDWYFRLFAA